MSSQKSLEKGRNKILFVVILNNDFIEFFKDIKNMY